LSIRRESFVIPNVSLKASTFTVVSNVLILSTGGISPPPSSVDSLIFLQAEKRIATAATVAKRDKAIVLFFTK
jgi:hypothetical protein